MSVDKTAEYLLTRNPNDWAHIYDVEYPTSGSDITGGDSLSVPDLQRMAKFWLMRDEIADAIDANDDLLAFYAPPTDAMGYARQANTNLLVELGRRDGIALPSMYGEALEDNDE